MNRRKHPKPGTIFQMTASGKLGPLMVVQNLHNDQNVYRVDTKGEIIAWGSIEDWYDEINRGWLKILYIP